MPGKFIDFYLPFAERGNLIPAKEQAARIITMAQEQIRLGHKGVAITYSANYDQTLKIHLKYQSAQWHTHTHGANQAQVISELEALQENEFKNLQHKIRIAPITTMTYTSFGGNTHDQVIREDLHCIYELLDNNWCVLGWINQVSSPQYAVGGGIAQVPQHLSVLIQDTLKEFAIRYSD